MLKTRTPNRNNTQKAKPAKDYGQAGWGDGVTTAETTHGAEELAKKAFGPETDFGFSGAATRRKMGGVLGKVLDFLFGKDPDIFDVYGRVRHKFSNEKWAKWDARFRQNPEYDFTRHTGADNALKNPSHKGR